MGTIPVLTATLTVTPTPIPTLTPEMWIAQRQFWATIWAALINVIGIGVAGLILKMYLDRQSEMFRHTLDRTAFEHQTRFAKMHEKRAEVITEVYRRLAETHRTFVALVNPYGHGGEPPKEHMAETTRETLNDFIVYLDNNRVFLDQRLCEQIDEFVRQLKTTYYGFQHSQDLRRSIRDSEKGIDCWDEALKQMEEQVPSLRRAIETEFRRLIGVTSGQDTES